eukprot:scaffold232457_cov24-Prasinocladus_malaysianus.AAC.1
MVSSDDEDGEADLSRLPEQHHEGAPPGLSEAGSSTMASEGSKAGPKSPVSVLSEAESDLEHVAGSSYAFDE